MASIEKTMFESASRSSRLRRLLSIGTVLLVAGIAALAWWYLQLPASSSLTHDTISEALVGAERAIVELDLGAGHLTLSAGSRDQMLTGQVQTLAGIETFERTARAQDGAMVYRLISLSPAAIREAKRWPEWVLGLNPELPLELSIRGGMGESRLDLSKLNLSKFNLDTAFGRYSVSLPEQGRVDAFIQGGSSRTTIYLPKDVPLTLKMQVEGAGHIEYNGRIYRRNAPLAKLTCRV